MAIEKQQPIALSIAAAADLVGLPESQIRRAIKGGELIHLKIGTKFLVMRVDLLAWLNSKQVSHGE